MFAEFFLRSRIEKMIASARVVMALVALLAIWLDPARPTAAVTPSYALLVGYFLFAIAVSIGSARSRISRRGALLSHAIDLAVFTFIIVVTDGPSSPFFLLFTFTLVSAAFRWRWRGAFATAATVLVLLTGIAFFHLQVTGGADFEVDRLFLRCAHVLALGTMLGAFVYYEEHTSGELQRLSSWRSDQRAADPEAALRRWMSHVSDVLGADRVVLVMDDAEEPWLSAAIWSDGELTRERLPIDAFGGMVAAPLMATVFLREAGSDDVGLLDAAGRVSGWRGVALDPALERRFGVATVISAPITSDAVSGRMFAFNPARAVGEDLMIAGLVAEQFGAALDRAAAAEASLKAAASEARLRLARDLHDGVLQCLAGTALQLEKVAKDPGVRAPAVQARIRKIQEWLISEQRELRGLIQDLRPGGPSAAGEQDISTALLRLGQGFEQRWGLTCRLKVEPLDLAVPALLSFQLHQILREAAANAARHGRASVLEIAVHARGGMLKLEVADNGAGLPVHGRFDANGCREAGIGPRSLRERVSGLGGRFILVSSGSGLRLEIELPLTFMEVAA